jgi:twitching motility protein PilT
MNNEIRWFARLGIDQGLFSRTHCIKLRKHLGDSADLGDFAQKLIDDDIVSDVGILEKLANVSLTKSKVGPPANDPFDETEDHEVKAESLTEHKKPGLTLKKSGEKNGPAPKFAFETVALMDDPSLAAGMRQLLKATSQHGASDLHLTSGARPFIRRGRALSFLSEYTLTSEDSLRLNTVLLSESQKKNFLERKDLDLALSVNPAERYRINLMFHKTGASGCYRMVPDTAQSLADLGFAAHVETLKRFLSYHNGLLLITGPVGSGKTTTLASMVDYLNETRTDHIITVEDPIEVIQPAKNCNVTQREVGPHTKSFFTALKGALREDPDVIIIGEMRDLETVEMAVTASETGHLVIGTMHTSDAATTLNRLLDVFPPAQQAQIRASVAESLRGIVCQRLLPGTSGSLVMACEIAVNNTAIAALIREGKTTGLRNTMETGVKEGMCLMDNVIFGLWQEKKVSTEVALANITNRVLRLKITNPAVTPAAAAEAAKKP